MGWPVARGLWPVACRNTMLSSRLSSGRGRFETFPYVPAFYMPAATGPRLLFRHGPRISAGLAGLVRGIEKTSSWPVACGLQLRFVACGSWFQDDSTSAARGFVTKQTSLPFGEGWGGGFKPARGSWPVARGRLVMHHRAWRARFELPTTYYAPRTTYNLLIPHPTPYRAPRAVSSWKVLATKMLRGYIERRPATCSALQVLITRCGAMPALRAIQTPYCTSS